MDNNTLYRHTTPSGKVYIGITNQNPEYRWNHGKGYMNCNGPFKSSIIKYGWDNIKHEILITNLTRTQAINWERRLIKHYKKLGISLNTTDGGEGVLGIIPYNKGIHTGKGGPKGKHLSVEHKLKLSAAHRGKCFQEHIKLHVYDIEGTYLGIMSTAQIRDILQIPLDNICRVCANKKGIANNYQFRYLEDKDVNIQQYDSINKQVTYPIVAKNIQTNEIKLFKSKFDLPRFLNCPAKRVFDTIRRQGHYKHWIYFKQE